VHTHTQLWLLFTVVAGEHVEKFSLEVESQAQYNSISLPSEQNSVTISDVSFNDIYRLFLQQIWTLTVIWP